MKRLLFTLFSLLLSFSLQAQIPDEYTNLKVLPKDISREKLIEVMKNFTYSLGVRCNFCHVGEEGKPLTTYNFSSDQKVEKQTARAMMQMVQAINADYLPKLPEKTGLQVGCVTCHHGLNRPRQLEDVLQTEIDKKGIQSAIAKYSDLRKQYENSFTFDFREGSLNNLAQRLMTAGKMDEALEILKLNAKNYPDSSMTYTIIGQVNEKKGNKADAVEAYKKAVALDPENPRAKQALDNLTNPQTQTKP
jgi:predicted Zn-dependent protease